MRNRQCIKKFAESKGLTFGTGSTFVTFVTTDGSSRTFHDSGKFEKKRDSTLVSQGTWQCDGVDNYFVWEGNKKYSSRTNSSTTMNTIFNCVKEELESRHMKYEFTSNELKLLFPRDKQHWTFYEDGKWGKFNTEDNSPVLIDGKPTVGTWECDGEEEYTVLTEWGIYNSKLNSWT
jgi:hypothetical protein